MVYREIMAVYPQIHTKHINTLCGQDVEFVNVKHGGNYFRANISLDGSKLLFARGWTCPYYQVKCAKLKLKFWFGVMKT